MDAASACITKARSRCPRAVSTGAPIIGSLAFGQAAGEADQARLVGRCERLVDGCGRRR